MLELDRCDLGSYLRERGLWAPGEPMETATLGGGISNIVVRVTTPRLDAVLKQALPRLRVQDDWPSRIDRVFREKECLETLHQLFGGCHVPRVLFEDRANFLFGMTCAPDGTRVWKAELMAGHIDPRVARRVGALAGTMHSASRRDPAIAALFGDQEVFDQLRLDPYYRTTAARHPDVAWAFEAQIERMAATRTALVHGDYSPKNLLLLPHDDIWILDCEVAHWGDPTFDLAFCLNQLFLKRIHLPRWAPLYRAAIAAFWQGYTDAAPQDSKDLERDTMAQLGCLMLARIDGKSPAEYIVSAAEKGRVRRVAYHIITEKPATLAAVHAVVDHDVGA
ncbi:MAG: aminoglycoside phosphotransferase family protein [Chloroflexota bacterium]